MKLKQWLPMGALALFASALAVIGIGLAWTVWGQDVWAGGMMNWNGVDLRPEFTMWDRTQLAGDPTGRTVGEGLDIDQVPQAVDRYLASIGLGELETIEVMDFERGYYVLVKEKGTGIGAMELIVDQISGAVRPEQGPNMMWNARYGMHGRGLGGRGMRGGASAANAITEAEARAAAERWLDRNRSGIVADDHADAFYGYYTFHTYRDGELEGMLSVNGSTEQVWYHTWHGAFVRMLESGDRAQ
jgi:hypothetical protein